MVKLTGFYVQDEWNTRLQEVCSPENQIYEGWDKVKSFLDGMMKESTPGRTSIKNAKEDFIIKIKGDCAWVVNKDRWSLEENGTPGSVMGLQTTFMEKINGSWKISMMACYFTDKPSGESKRTTAIK